MSDVHLIKGDFNKLATNLPLILEKHMLLIDQADSRLIMSGKTIETCLKEQGAYPIQYAVAKSELNAICKYITAEIGKIRGELYRKYVEDYSRELSDRGRNQYIDTDTTYLNYNQLLIEVEELYEQMTAVVDAFQTRGFALRDTTTIRVNQLHNTVI